MGYSGQEILSPLWYEQITIGKPWLSKLACGPWNSLQLDLWLSTVLGIHHVDPNSHFTFFFKCPLGPTSQYPIESTLSQASPGIQTWWEFNQSFARVYQPFHLKPLALVLLEIYSANQDRYPVISTPCSISHIWPVWHNFVLSLIICLTFCDGWIPSPPFPASFFFRLSETSQGQADRSFCVHYSSENRKKNIGHWPTHLLKLIRVSPLGNWPYRDAQEGMLIWQSNSQLDRAMTPPDKGF